MQLFSVSIHKEVGVLQESRLFRILYYLLDKKHATAPELARKFEVSVRTIYRDVDRLSSAGIPIYITTGRNGGIALLDGYVLNKFMISEKEKQEILIGVQSLSAIQYPNTENILTKLGALFGTASQNIIDVDFSRWGSTAGREKQLFHLLKNAILERMQLRFDYFTSNGKNTHREVQPYKLLYKDKAWYLYAFCLLSNDWRLFRITRIKNCVTTNIHFEAKEKDSPHIWPPPESMGTLIDIELTFPHEVGYRLYDLLDDSSIFHEQDRIRVSLTLPENEWLYDFIMSFGDKVTIIHPKSLRDKIVKRYLEALAHYEEEYE